MQEEEGMRKPRVEARKVEGGLGLWCVDGGHEVWFITGEQCELAQEMWGTGRLIKRSY